MSDRGTTFKAADGRCFQVRPLLEGDEQRIAAFFKHVDADDVRLRFFHAVRTFDHHFLWPLVHYDRRQGIAFIAIDTASGQVAGGGRLHCDILRTFGEFAILIRSDLKHEGLGRFLMTLLIDWAVSQSIPLIKGDVLRENAPMLALCRSLGFRVRAAHDDPALMMVELAVSSCQSTTTLVPSVTRE